MLGGAASGHNGSVMPRTRLHYAWDSRVTRGLRRGPIRSVLGDYQLAFWIAGTFCVLAGMSFLTLGRSTFSTSRRALPRRSLSWNCSSRGLRPITENTKITKDTKQTIFASVLRGLGALSDAPEAP